MINRRVEVQRCPAVPTAPKTAPITVILMSASGVTMMALFPPNSNNDLPNLPATDCATNLPIRVDHVAETKGTRVSAVINSPIL